MKTKRFFQVLLLGAALFCVSANVEASSQHNGQQAVRVEKQKAQKVEKQKVVGNSLRTTTAVKLRKSASSKASTVKDKKGRTIVVPKGASVKVIKSTNYYYKVDQVAGSQHYTHVLDPVTVQPYSENGYLECPEYGESPACPYVGALFAMDMWIDSASFQISHYLYDSTANPPLVDSMKYAVAKDGWNE